MSEQQPDNEISTYAAIEAGIPIEEPKKPKSRKKAHAADLGLNPATIRARAIVLGRLKG